MGPSRTHFSPRLAARVKMSLSRAQNIFMPANINSIVILTIFRMVRLPANAMYAPKDFVKTLLTSP